MRLYPPVPVVEALEYLRLAAEATWGIQDSPAVVDCLRPLARAMSRISHADVPDESEPLLL